MIRGLRTERRHANGNRRTAWQTRWRHRRMRTDAHRTWLRSVLDREECELISTNESPLFETDLAELIKTHFQGVLDQMAEMQREGGDEQAEEENSEAAA